MLNFFSKLIFLSKKPKVVMVSAKGSPFAISAIFQVLKKFFKTAKISKNFPTSKEILKSQILLFEGKGKKGKFWLKKSSQPILVTTHLGEIPPEDIIFASERSKEILDLAEVLPSFGYLILNFDDETVREIGDTVNVHSLTFGFDNKADLVATDCHSSKKGTTFKLNFKGNILPIWLANLLGKKNVYGALAALSIAQVFNLNLVEVSQILRNWQGIEGEGRIIQGIKGSLVFDDSKNSSPFSMVGALKILGEIKTEERKIAVLGDILGIGKYTIESHEAIGERVVKNSDILFTVGKRAKFIAKGARDKGMDSSKIFEFDDLEKAGIALKNEIRENDLILVDGSTEMKMEEIVKEIRKV